MQFCLGPAAPTPHNPRMKVLSSRRAGTWIPAARLPRSRVPPDVLPWLLDTGSLTERLIAACPGRFAVHLLGQQRTRPLREEAAALGLASGVQALVRQVQLQCDARPWVLARTVIPLTTLTGPRRRLARLGNRSLGAVLFADPTMTRGPVEVTRLPAGSALFRVVTASLKKPPPDLWGRRSVFRLNGWPLLVSEYFLPSLARFPE